jgi:hypothetical protein
MILERQHNKLLRYADEDNAIYDGVTVLCDPVLNISYINLGMICVSKFISKKEIGNISN